MELLDVKIALYRKCGGTLFWLSRRTSHISRGGLPWIRRSCEKAVERHEIFFFRAFFWNRGRMFIKRPLFLFQLAFGSRHAIKSSISSLRLYKAARARPSDKLNDKAELYEFVCIRCIMDAPRIPDPAELFQSRAVRGYLRKAANLCRHQTRIRIRQRDWSRFWPLDVRHSAELLRHL
jgi:hypothetical protein